MNFVFGRGDVVETRESKEKKKLYLWLVTFLGALICKLFLIFTTGKLHLDWRKYTKLVLKNITRVFMIFEGKSEYRRIWEWVFCFECEIRQHENDSPLLRSGSITNHFSIFFEFRTYYVNRTKLHTSLLVSVRRIVIDGLRSGYVQRATMWENECSCFCATQTSYLWPKIAVLESAEILLLLARLYPLLIILIHAECYILRSSPIRFLPRLWLIMTLWLTGLTEEHSYPCFFFPFFVFFFFFFCLRVAVSNQTYIPISETRVIFILHKKM